MEDLAKSKLMSYQVRNEKKFKEDLPSLQKVDNGTFTFFSTSNVVFENLPQLDYWSVGVFSFVKVSTIRMTSENCIPSSNRCSIQIW